MNKIFLATILTLLIGACSLPSFSRTVQATISVAPIQITITPGQSFTINITVGNVNNLNAWQLALKYDAAVVSCKSAWIPQDNVFAGLSSIPVSPILDRGTLDGKNYTLYGNVLLTGSVAVSQGLLCKLNFTCEGYGTTSLQIGTSTNPIKVGTSPWNAQNMYSFLLDWPDQNEMAFATVDGVATDGLQPTLTIVSAAGGTTTPTPGNYSYTYGENVSVTAVPQSSYSLDYWLVDSSNLGNANPFVVLMTSNHTLQPFFTHSNCTLVVTGTLGGNSSLLPGTYTNTCGELVQISATPDSSHIFSYWLIDLVNANSSNPISIAMNSDHSITPIFYSASHAYVYIRSDGSIDPTGVPLTTSDNTTYELAADLNSMITIQRSNISFLGNGHSLQGSGTGECIRLIGVDNVSIADVNIRGFDNGIALSGTSGNLISDCNVTTNDGLGISLYGSCNNTIRRNNVTDNNGEGIHLDFSSNYNEIFGNNIRNNSNQGIYIDSSSDNLVYHNNMVNNTSQVYVAAYGNSPSNFWDDGVEGNYWSNYAGIDSEPNGLGDTPFVIDASNLDHFPLMGTFSTFDLPQGSSINVVSNSTLTEFYYSSHDRRISFHVEGKNGTRGFCEIAIPHILMDVTRLEIVIDNGNEQTLYLNLAARDNSTHRWIIFSYEQSAHTIKIQENWTPPTIAVLSPENRTYSANSVLLRFTVSEETSWKGYSLDGSTNVTITGNTTLTNLPDGSHAIIVYANDTVGNMGRADAINFTIDTTPPTIVILSPENKTYSVNDVSLSFTVSEQTSWVGCSFDSNANVTTVENETLSNIVDGAHFIIIYCNDTIGNMGVSNTVFFLVDTTPPNITGVFQNPLGTNVLLGQMVTVNTTIIDDTSGLKSVNMNYTYTNGSGTFTGVISFTNLQGNVWNVTIPTFPYGTNVTYAIIAEDNAGNVITTNEIGLDFEYSVMPEYSTPFLLAILALSLLLTVVLAERKNPVRINRKMSEFL